VGLTTRPPGGVPGGGLPEPGAPVPRELRALIEELRSLVAAAGTAARALPPLPEPTGAAPEPALARWFRAALDSGSLPAPALRSLVDQAVERLAGASGVAPEARPLEAAREALLRLVAAAEGSPGRAPAAPAPPPAAPPDQALALRMLAEEIRRAVVDVIGTEPPWVAPPAAAEDPGNAGAALLGWLRTAAARAGVPLATLETAIEAGAGRALALLPPAGGSAALAAAITAARDVVGRGLDAARAASAAGQGPLEVLVAEIAGATGELLGPGATLLPPPAVSGDPGHAAQLISGWLRGAMLGTGASPQAIRAAVDAGSARALATAGADPAGRAVIEATRGLIGQALAPSRESPGAPQLLYRPDLPPRSVAGPGGRGVVDGGERVQPIGEDDGARGHPRRGAGGAPSGDGPAGEEPPAAGGTEGPMQCIRRCVDALLAGDAAAYTAEWVYPACFWIDGRWLACADQAALASLQARILRGRRERGVVGGRILLLRVDPVSESVALVHVLASEERGDRRAREVETLYTTVRADGGWRVAVAVAK
jgi:hypothetical protein